MNQKPNRLIHEKSPYLQQHAYQPIDWYPWGDEAFDKAKNEDKLIFLSIGYSTCHWCHVMSRESFADDEVAKLLNDSFVAIKVDREERPDIDQVYMEMAQVMTGRVGWPLTIIMTPDQIPFFATTYLPKEGDGQYYGLIEILTLFHTKWCVKREDIYRSVNQVQEYFRVRSETHHIQNLDQEVLDVAFETLLESFDSRYGGYGSAPKFPMPHYLSFLLRYGLLLDVPEAVHMMDKTLKAMYKGGIYDHLGGGFARYSVDEKWLVPHFEKMCDDNALLAIMYCEAYRHTNHPLYKKIVRDTLKFIERELLSPEGAFYTAIDADSEGEEGKYYVWSQSQLLDSLSDDEYQLFMEYYQLSEFEHGSIINRIHIHDDELSNIPEEIERIEKKLLHVRQTRPYPHRDEKILTRNNGIMIAAFVNAYVTFDEPHYLDIAEKAVSFILNKLCDEDGRLYARYIDGERKFLAYADDYAFLIWGLIDLFLATGKPLYLNHALAFTEDMKKYYYDDENGGFYFSAHDSEKLIFRNKEFFDGAIPSSNAVMAMNYIRLAEIIDHPEYEELAVGILEAFGKEITKSPTSYLYALTAYLYFKIPKRKIVLVTESVNEQTKHLQQIIWKQCVPCTQMITLLKDDIKGSPYFSYYLEDPRPISLHICENYMCNDPIHDYDEMIHALENLYTKTE